MNSSIDGIDELPSGRFRVRWQVRGKRVSGTFATAEEAASVRDAALRELADENFEHVDGESPYALTPSFLAARRKFRTADNDESRWYGHVREAKIARKPVAAITTFDVYDWLEELRKKPSTMRQGRSISVQTRRHCLNLFRGFFKWAMKRQLVATNPCNGVLVEREDGDEVEGWQPDWYLTPQEQEVLLRATPEGNDRRMVAVAIGTGLRLRELLCLHLDDIHVEASEPYIEVRFGSWDAGKKRFRPPKGRTGEKKPRIVPLFGLALAAVKAQLADMPERNKYRLAFPSRWGGRRTHPPKSWNLAPGIVRLRRQPWWHLLRHACASSLVNGWWGVRWSLEDAQRILGHSSVTVTERYAHLTSSVVQGAATATHAAWTARDQGRGLHLVTASNNRLKSAEPPGLRSRMSSVRIGPGVLRFHRDPMCSLLPSESSKITDVPHVS
ncbi:MAG: tyrosine-type recombinase/integrase, partial [Polyangiaceae bacterium]